MSPAGPRVCVRNRAFALAFVQATAIPAEGKIMIARVLCAVSVLALAACDGGTQQTGDAGQTAPTTTSPAPPVTTEAPAPATEPTTTTTAEAPTKAPEPGGTAPSTGTTSSAAPPVSGAGGPSPGATPPSIASLQGTPHRAGPVSIALRPDNTFEMQSSATNENVTGNYTYEDGVISFVDPKGDIGGAEFPMQCRVVPTDAGGFQLADAGGNCSYFQDLHFRR
jgi:hypothetical protein